MTSHYISGLDLGKLQDYTALVTVEQYVVDDKDLPGRKAWQHDVRHINRWPLGTPYARIVADLRDLYVKSPMNGSSLVVDKTGVGEAVMEMIQEAHLPCSVRGYSITAGFKPGDGTVPKQDLVGALHVGWGSERLRIAKGLDYRPILIEEIRTFTSKVSSERNETYAAWRENEHDDILLALSLAVWYGSRHPPQEPGPPSGKTVFDGLPPGTFGPTKNYGRVDDPNRWR